MLDEVTTAALTDYHDSKAFIAPSKSSIPAHPENNDPHVPSFIWRIMFGAYAIFFGALWIATGNDRITIFMLVISIGYAVMYFGTASVLFRLNMTAKPVRQPAASGLISTNTGPMSVSAVAGQMLTIPFCLALFGVAIAIIGYVVRG